MLYYYIVFSIRIFSIALFGYFASKAAGSTSSIRYDLRQRREKFSLENSNVQNFRRHFRGKQSFL